MTYRTDSEKTRDIMLAGLTGAVLILGVSIGFTAPLEVTYELLHVDAAGDVWSLDYDLSAEDCAARMRDYPAEFALSCVPEINR